MRGHAGRARAEGRSHRQHGKPRSYGGRKLPLPAEGVEGHGSRLGGDSRTDSGESEATNAGACGKDGGRMSGGSPTKRERNQSVLDAVAGGESSVEVAQRFGISKQRVNQIVFPERKRARKRVESALVSGTLKRPDKCSTCNQRVPVQAHHADYSQPFSVTWLCSRCHSLADKVESNRYRYIPGRVAAERKALSSLASELADA